jgi:hypothetical protein
MSPRTSSSAAISAGGPECRGPNTNHTAMPINMSANSAQPKDGFKCQLLSHAEMKKPRRLSSPGLSFYLLAPLSQVFDAW